MREILNLRHNENPDNEGVMITGELSFSEEEKDKGRQSVIVGVHVEKDKDIQVL